MELSNWGPHDLSLWSKISLFLHYTLVSTSPICTIVMSNVGSLWHWNYPVFTCMHCVPHSTGLWDRCITTRAFPHSLHMWWYTHDVLQLFVHNHPRMSFCYWNNFLCPGDKFLCVIRKHKISQMKVPVTEINRFISTHLVRHSSVLIHSTYQCKLDFVIYISASSFVISISPLRAGQIWRALH